jgi:hypothetical protein
VQCKIYLKVEHKDKILATKWNSLQKHVDQKNDDLPMKGVKKGEWYTNNDYKQSRNQASYVSKGREFVLEQVTNELVGEKCRKLVQFATLFHTLKHGRPMLEYEVHKDLFDFLNLEENPKCIWIDDSGWVMVQHMHCIILEVVKFVVGVAQ